MDMEDAIKIQRKCLFSHVASKLFQINHLVVGQGFSSGCI
jgi:hypothetical protein